MDLMRRISILIMAIIFGQATYSQCTYYVSSGVFKFPDGSTVQGYSGFNNTRSDDVRDLYGQYYYNSVDNSDVPDRGSIPCGTYYITGCDNSIGPYTLILSQDGATNTYGRNGFRIHGDNSSHNASRGCIILGKEAREKIAHEYENAKNQGRVLTLYVYE